MVYCFCNRVSYGEMIACDNPDCDIEWFHMDCVGLPAGFRPEGSWCAFRRQQRAPARRARIASPNPPPVLPRFCPRCRTSKAAVEAARACLAPWSRLLTMADTLGLPSRRAQGINLHLWRHDCLCASHASQQAGPSPHYVCQCRRAVSTHMCCVMLAGHVQRDLHHRGTRVQRQAELEAGEVCPHAALLHAPASSIAHMPCSLQQQRCAPDPRVEVLRAKNPLLQPSLQAARARQELLYTGRVSADRASAVLLACGGGCMCSGVVAQRHCNAKAKGPQRLSASPPRPQQRAMSHP